MAASRSPISKGIDGMLAAHFDVEMILSNKTKIASQVTKDSELDQWEGKVVKKQIGSRYLLHYLPYAKLGRYDNGTDDRIFCTPTVYTRSVVIDMLALPDVGMPRPLAIVIDPAQLSNSYPILGPRYVRFGMGVEYILTAGFPANAVVSRFELVIP